jgi:hypothetical protein
MHLSHRVAADASNPALWRCGIATQDCSEIDIFVHAFYMHHFGFLMKKMILLFCSQPLSYLQKMDSSCRMLVCITFSTMFWHLLPVVASTILPPPPPPPATPPLRGNDQIPILFCILAFFALLIGVACTFCCQIQHRYRASCKQNESPEVHLTEGRVEFRREAAEGRV